MRCVVLCPGPSLGRINALGFRRRLRGAFVIGVNSVVEEWPVDGWAALDGETFEMFSAGVLERARERGLLGGGAVKVTLPKVLMMDPGVDRLIGAGASLEESGAGGNGKFAVVRTSALKELGPPESFADYSTPAALVWAAMLGADVIQVVGADMEGTADYRGVEGGNRDESRWNQEREIFDRVADWIRARGIWFERLQFAASHG